MCGPTRSNSKSLKDAGALEHCDDGRGAQLYPQQHSFFKRAFHTIYPMNPLVVVAFFPLVPYSWYLNRGFTVWFHLLAAAHALTRSQKLARFQALLGISICLGWYASILLDFVWFQRPVFRLLYQNMPECMTIYMFQPETTTTNDGTLGMVLKYDSISIGCMILSHVLDAIGHPLLTFYFWKKRCGNDTRLYSWRELGLAFLVSRMWSLVHCSYNNQDGVLFGLYYTGFDVYRMDSVQQWYPAYIAEALYFVVLVLYKFITNNKKSSKSVQRLATSHTNTRVHDNEIITEDSDSNSKPALVYSDSAMESFLEE